MGRERYTSAGRSRRRMGEGDLVESVEVCKDSSSPRETKLSSCLHYCLLLLLLPFLLYDLCLSVLLPKQEQIVVRIVTLQCHAPAPPTLSSLLHLCGSSASFSP